MKNRTYRYFDGQVLYPFGYGLSYTGYEYSPIQMPAAVKSGDNVKVSVNVKNTGIMDGEEVVQLYMSYPGVNGQKPLYALKAFDRVSLKAGESKTVEFNLSPGELGLVDDSGVLKVSSGKRKLYIGGTSPTPTYAEKLPVVEKDFEITGSDFIVD
jgi:beta-glucosidase